MLHLLLVVAASLAATPASGAYEQLKLAFADGRVQGAFSEQRAGNGTDAAPQFSCGFELTGVWHGDHADVLTWWPGETAPDTRIPGRLTVQGAVATLSLKDDPGGCEMIGEEFKTEPFEAKLGAAHPWIGFRQVRVARARFHAAPGGPARVAYVVQGDTLAVLARRSGWIEAEYVDGARPVRGWIAEADLERAGPDPPIRVNPSSRGRVEPGRSRP